MQCDAQISPASISSTHYALYNSSLTTISSTSNLSVWSDTSSQTSDDSSSHSSDSDSCDSYCLSKQAPARRHVHKVHSEAVPVELRQNPRRSSGLGRTAAPPTLVRQAERKVNFVDSLVEKIQCLDITLLDSSTQIVEAIWPLSSVVCRNELGNKAVLPLRTFIQETLRRSRTSYSTLQVALYYLILIKPHVPKHNFTTEQPDDRHADRALQCGRRMFLAALILASKYLQDRNYSARAWSKISGLNTQEINQNEIAFLLAVNWKLHIADDVFQRWTEIVLKYTPPPGPSSPGGVSQIFAQQVTDWKQIILRLNPELTNIANLIPCAPLSARSSDLCAMSPRSILNLPQDSPFDSASVNSTAKLCNAPVFMEPAPTSAYTPSRVVPALGLLPTPRLTPQSSGFCTPAVSAASTILGKSSAMGMAMAQATNANVSQYLDRLPMSITSSPMSYCPMRRSSLANSISTASSPESMMSDSSRSSRSSSISSASSLASATLSNKLGMQSRFRATKLCSERRSQRPSIPSVPEDYVEHCYSSSPESYTGPVGKLEDMALETPLARREQQLQESDAARALQELQNYRISAEVTPIVKAGLKRSRAPSMDNPLQENVRDLLWRGYSSTDCPAWPDTLVHSRRMANDSHLRVPVAPTFPGSGKRVCCSVEAAQAYETSSVYPAIGIRGPGMWEGILN
ncbi:Fc.00g038250.m01.CDS01 [Cosmosporella sp. VM-42]